MSRQIPKVLVLHQRHPARVVKTIRQGPNYLTWSYAHTSGKSHKKANISILVVDDEESIRDILNHAMQQSGFHCVTAADGTKALDILAEHDIDVIITDIQIPNLNGIELTKIVKEKYDSDVIMMTGFVRDYTYEEIIEKGASDFVQKPVSIKELIIRVKRVLKERELLHERTRAVAALRESERRYRELSIKDGLTGLYNSRHFFEKLHDETLIILSSTTTHTVTWKVTKYLSESLM